jgi:hypothetical protein
MSPKEEIHDMHLSQATDNYIYSLKFKGIYVQNKLFFPNKYHNNHRRVVLANHGLPCIKTQVNQAFKLDHKLWQIIWRVKGEKD